MEPIFNRNLLRQHRDRAGSAIHDHDFLLREMAARLIDRLPDINRRFPLALELGAHHGVVAQMLEDTGGIEHLVQTDLSLPQLKQASGLRVAADEEALPFAEHSFDLVISVGSLHWVNDLPGTLAQIRHVLKPDGLFLASLPGGETLKELRLAFEQAEMQCSGGISPRISPFIDVRDAGSLLQRAGFALPVVDSERLTVRYETPLKLLHDLRGMGETNTLLHRTKSPMRRELLFAAMEHYRQHYIGNDGRVPATFDLITLTAWKPHGSQQQPLKRGSGQMHLGKMLE